MVLERPGGKFNRVSRTIETIAMIGGRKEARTLDRAWVSA
jgi:hypothetical protein